MYDLCPQLVGITELLLRLLNVVKMDDEFEDEKGGRDEPAHIRNRNCIYTSVTEVYISSFCQRETTMYTNN